MSPLPNTTNDDQVPVGTVFPAIDRDNWNQVTDALSTNEFPANSFEDWKREQQSALNEEDPLCPLVPINVQYRQWKDFCDNEGRLASFDSITKFAMNRFSVELKILLENATEYDGTSVIKPACFLLVLTEQIGQDYDNDVSNIVRIDLSLDGTERETKKMTMV